MSTFDGAELAEAITERVETGGFVGDKLERVGDAALNELLRRLEDPESAKELPGTGLLNIANAYVKAREREIARQADVPDPADTRDDIEVILDSTLSAWQKAEQLRLALDRLDAKRRRILDLLEGGLDTDE